MADAPFSDFNRMMRDVRLPAAARERIRADIHAQARVTARTDTAADRPTRGRPVPIARRALAIAACTGVLVIGGLALSAYLGEQEAQQHGQSSANANGGFVLRAYAEGAKSANPDGAGSIVRADGLVTDSGGWSEGDPVEGGAVGSISVQWTLDLRCLGTEIETLRISLPTNDSVSLIYLRDRAADDDRPGDSMSSAMTVKPADIGNDTYALWFTLPVTGDLKTAQETFNQSQRNLLKSYPDATDWPEEEVLQHDRALNDYTAAIYEAAANALKDQPLTITATMRDGRTVTHVYRFAPVDDFRATVIANRETVEDNSAEFKPFLTIEQLK